MTKLKIGLDCRLAGEKYAAGIGRYITNLALNLPETTDEFDWIYFFSNQEQQDHVLSELSASAQSKITGITAPIRHYSFAEQLRWPKILADQNLDLLHVPHFNIPVCYQGKLVVTVHDLLWHQQIGPKATTLPGWKYYFKYLAYRFVTSQAIKKSEFVFVPAETVKDTVADYFPQSKDKLIVTKEGISACFKNKFSRLQTELDANLEPDQTLIYVGSLYPHKNIDLVLSALTKLPDLKLIVVSARNIFADRFLDQVKQLGLETRVKFTGFIPDSKLVDLISSSLALVQPSLSEGFGLTGVEAMACGTPVLASDLPIFREIYQQAPLYFDPHQTESLLAAINRIRQPQIRKTQIELGLETVNRYSWKRMAEKTAHHYRDALRT